MTDVRAERVRELFASAADLVEGERRAFLRRECGVDLELLAELESLFEHDGEEHATFDEADLGEGKLFGSQAGRIAASAHAAALAIGTRIGRYTITGTLGAGGMGTVYEAEQDEPRRRVALKMLRPELAAPQVLERFRHEAEVLGRLQHAGIAQIFEAGSFESASGPQPFFAMELVAGEPLHRYAGRHALGARACLELVAMICDAVGHAHAKGVAHRDLKPDNVLVDVAGRPKVLDFGVARLTGEDTLLASMHTGVGELVGTLQYMSPEQVAGDPQRVDARADVYALGAILYELLAGKRPYDLAGRSLPDAARTIQEVEPSRLGSQAPGLRGDVEVIVEQALAKEPERRYPNAAELAADIRRFLADRPIHARSLSTFYFLGRFARRHRALVAGTLLALASLLAALVVSIFQTQNALSARASAERETSFARIAAAAAAIEADTPRFAREMLEQVAEADRGWEWHYLTSSLDEAVLEIDLGAELVAATLAPDGKSVLALVRSGELRRIPVAPGASSSSCVLDASGIRAACFSTDGLRVAALFGAGPGSAAVWEIESGALVWSGPGVDAEAPLLDLREERLGAAWVASNSTVSVWDAPTGAVRTFQLGNQGILKRRSALALHDGRLAVALVWGGIALFDRTGAREARPAELQQSAPVITALAFSSDGRRLASGSKDKRIRTCELASPRHTKVLAGHTAAVGAVVFGPDDASVISLASDGTMRVWDAASGSVSSTPARAPGAERILASRAGGQVLTSPEPGQLQVWDPLLRERLTVLRGHTSYVYPVAFAPDGGKLASGSWDTTVRLWDVASRSCDWVAERRGKVELLCFSPAGERIAVGGTGKDLCFLDAATGEIALSSDERFGHGSSFAWFPDGRRWVYSGGHAGAEGQRLVKIFDARDAHELARFDVGEAVVSTVAVAPDGGSIALGTKDGGLILLELAGGGEARAFAAHEQAVSSLAFDPDGARLVSSSLDGSALVIDARSGATLRAFEGHTGRVYSAVWSPDGQRIATGAEDSIVRIYDPDSAVPLLSLRGHDDYAYSVAFSPDGSLLASGSGDGTVRLWDARPLRERIAADAEPSIR